MPAPVDLRRLIAASFDEKAAEAWSKFTIGEDDKKRLREAGRQVLLLFKTPIPGACCVMSAAYSVMLEAAAEKPAYVVAGSLYVGDTRIFGEDGEFDGEKHFSVSSLGWDGHAWIVYGEWLADVSILRTANGSNSPRKLRAHCKDQFAGKTGLYACKMGTEIKEGFRYEPRYVLTLDQVNALAGGANQFIQCE